MPFVDRVDELVEGVPTSAVQPPVDDGENVIVCRFPVDVDLSEYGDDILRRYGVFDLMSVDDESLYHIL